MRVLQNNYNKNAIESYPRTLTCENCGSMLEYEKSDMRIGEFGCCLIACPLCHYENVDDENCINLTKNNIRYPDYFHHTSKETGAVEYCNNTNVTEAICNAIEYFRKNKRESFWYAQCGDMHVSVYRFDGDECYDVVVSNNFYSTSIPFEDEDY